VDLQIRISEPALADFVEILESWDRLWRVNDSLAARGRDHIYAWIKRPEPAERFGNALLDHLELLRRFPSMGRPVAARSGVRQLVHAPIIVYYQVHEEHKHIEVLHFCHGRRRAPDSR
jgi:plasmid stabilization system protein ParE